MSISPGRAVQAKTLTVILSLDEANNVFKSENDPLSRVIAKHFSCYMSCNSHSDLTKDCLSSILQMSKLRSREAEDTYHGHM